MKATDTEILIRVVHFENWSWGINQEDLVGYDDGGGTIIFIAS